MSAFLQADILDTLKEIQTTIESMNIALQTLIDILLKEIEQ
jgi:hypothetical protein